MRDLLQKQKAIVTGGTAGIGKAIALKLAENGAQVAIFGTSVERGALVVQEINQATGGYNASFFAVDVAKSDQVEEAIKKVLAIFGQVDILVNNAGITCDKLLMRMEEQDWDNIMDVNVKSCYNTCRVLIRNMLKAKRGKIINIGSVVGLMGNAGQTNYAASKAAVVGFTKALAKEVASRGVCVNCVAPGFIETKMTGVMTEVQKQETLAKIPLGRMGQPEEIANMVLFLASSMGDYITGQVIAVDGGMVM